MKVATPFHGLILLIFTFINTEAGATGLADTIYLGERGYPQSARRHHS